MATPYVAGAVALALEAAPAATPTQVKTALTSSALDVGIGGKDNDWGAGLVDVRALVDAVRGLSLTRTPFPTWERKTGSVPTNGSGDVPVVVPADGLGVPFAITLTVTSGSLSCDLLCQMGRSTGEWSPDLDVELRDPDGVIVADSQCALSGVSCSTGRQETIGVVPQKAGTYTLRVFAWSGGDGAGGSFTADISRGPLSGTTPDPDPDPEPVPNQAPTANAGPDQTVTVARKGKKATFVLQGSGSDPDGTIASWTWRQGGTIVGTAQNVTLSRGVGTYVFTLTVTDDDGATDSDSMTVTVSR